MPTAHPRVVFVCPVETKVELVRVAALNRRSVSSECMIAIDKHLAEQNDADAAK